MSAKLNSIHALSANATTMVRLWRSHPELTDYFSAAFSGSI